MWLLCNVPTDSAWGMASMTMLHTHSSSSLSWLAVSWLLPGIVWSAKMGKLVLKMGKLALMMGNLALKVEKLAQKLISLSWR